MTAIAQPKNLGDVLKRYPKVLVPEMNTGHLAKLVRAEFLVDARTAAGNQLTAMLDAFWPGAHGLFADITSAIELAFLARPCTQQYISLLENGTDRDCSEDIAIKICKALDVELEDYFEAREIVRTPPVATASRGRSEDLAS